MAKDEKRPLKVFLCHASGDKPPVRDLYKKLTAEGVDAWLDKEKLLPGQDWKREIPKAVQESDVVVVCLSKKSITKEGYVQKEIKFALDIAEEKPEGTIFLIPARLEECEVPSQLGSWQWVDLYEEDGFIKLLRSLKSRANAAGAIIEPISDEATDKELERKLEQLYTEGLAAFYTEDWDRACRRFRTILSEQPNYRKAAEKLADAECQRDLAKLYAQATEAYQSENWQIAIGALEELSQKSADYKDTAQLLRDVRRQKQLRELYAEAKALHAGQKWQAVVKVFRQITIIEPNYPDAEGLLASAQKEVAELERLAKLDEQYNHALREMESGNWYGARGLLENIHKSQTGFLETEKLLRKVDDEISREEEKRRQNDEINTLYEQAHGLLRAKKWRNALEKLEQIRKLDERFPDTERIAEKAQKELESEEQEAERQNRLAALYAESVRLLKEEKYQEALDKWQEVKALDPKYPDRQSVQRIATKKLTELAKQLPEQSKTRLLELGSLGITLIAIFVIGLITAALLNNRSDPVMYDDFENTQYDGSYDKTKWGYWVSDVNAAPFVQENGELVINMSGNKDLDINLLKYQREVLKEPTFLEVKVFLEPNPNAYLLMVAIESIHGNVTVGSSGCTISNNPVTFSQSIGCSNDYFGQHQGVPINLNTNEPEWHMIRIEIDPHDMKTAFVVDGERFGSSALPQPEKFKTYCWRFSPSMHRENLNDSFPIARFEYVRFGALEDDPGNK